MGKVKNINILSSQVLKNAGLKTADAWSGVREMREVLCQTRLVSCGGHQE